MTYIVLMGTLIATHSLTHSLTRSLTHSLTHSLDPLSVWPHLFRGAGHEGRAVVVPGI